MDRSKKNTLKRWLGRGAAALLLAGASAALALAARPAPLAVDTAAAARGPLRVTVDEDGKTRVKARYVVSAPLAGRLARIDLRPGDPVAAGVPLARLMPASAPLLDERTRSEAEARVSAAMATRKQSEVAVERSKVGLDLARAEAERVRSLASSGALAPSALEKADGESKLRAAEVDAALFGAQIASHELAVARSAAARIRPGKPSGESFDVSSPVDGAVLRVLQESEAVVPAGTPLVEVGDTRNLEIVVDVLTTDAVLIKPGMKASIERWSAGAALGEELAPLAAHVRSVEPAAFSRPSALGVDEQRVNVLLDLDEPRERWASLGDGFRVDASIIVREIPGALVVPLGAVFRKAGAWSVFVVAGGKASLRSVTVGARSGASVEIKSGLGDGEPVIVHPSDRVTEGSPVKPRG